LGVCAGKLPADQLRVLKFTLRAYGGLV